ncbi:MAG: hypothetical protein V1725_07555 [archaeon]
MTDFVEMITKAEETIQAKYKELWLDQDNAGRQSYLDFEALFKLTGKMPNPETVKKGLVMRLNMLTDTYHPLENKVDKQGKPGEDLDTNAASLIIRVAKGINDMGLHCEVDPDTMNRAYNKLLIDYTSQKTQFAGLKAAHHLAQLTGIPVSAEVLASGISHALSTSDETKNIAFIAQDTASFLNDPAALETIYTGIAKKCTAEELLAYEKSAQKYATDNTNVSMTQDVVEKVLASYVERNRYADALKIATAKKMLPQ